MALKFKFKTREEIPAELQSLYVEREGVWTLDAEGVVEWRAADAKAARRTAAVVLPAKAAVEVRLEGLAPDTAYVARVLVRAAPSRSR